MDRFEIPFAAGGPGPAWLACVPARRRARPPIVGSRGDAHDRAACRSSVQPAQPATSGAPAPPLGQCHRRHEDGHHGRHGRGRGDRRRRADRAGPSPRPVRSRVGPRAVRAAGRPSPPRTGEPARARGSATTPVIGQSGLHLGSRSRSRADVPWASRDLGAGGRRPARPRGSQRAPATCWWSIVGARLAPPAYGTGTPEPAPLHCRAGRNGQGPEGHLGTGEWPHHRVDQCLRPGAGSLSAVGVHSRRELGGDRSSRTRRPRSRPGGRSSSARASGCGSMGHGRRGHRDAGLLRPCRDADVRIRRHIVFAGPPWPVRSRPVLCRQLRARRAERRGQRRQVPVPTESPRRTRGSQQGTAHRARRPLSTSTRGSARRRCQVWAGGRDRPSKISVVAVDKGQSALSRR